MNVKPSDHNGPIVLAIAKNIKKNVPEVHPLLPPFLNFLWCLIGKPRSGKSTLALTIMKEYAKYFDYFYIVSPTAGDDPSVQEFSEEFSKVAGKNLWGEEKHLAVLSDLENLPQLVKHIISLKNNPVRFQDGKRLKDPIFPKIFLFVDDATGETKYTNEKSAFGKLCNVRRHKNVAIMIAVHRDKSSVKNIKQTCDLLSIWGQASSEESKDIIKQHFNSNINEIGKLLSDTAKEDHAFITFHKYNSTITKNLAEKIEF